MNNETTTTQEGQDFPAPFWFFQHRETEIQRDQSTEKFLNSKICEKNKNPELENLRIGEQREILEFENSWEEI